MCARFGSPSGRGGGVVGLGCHLLVTHGVSAPFPAAGYPASIEAPPLLVPRASSSAPMFRESKSIRKRRGRGRSRGTQRAGGVPMGTCPFGTQVPILGTTVPKQLCEACVHSEARFWYQPSPTAATGSPRPPAPSPLKITPTRCFGCMRGAPCGYHGCCTERKAHDRHRTRRIRPRSPKATAGFIAACAPDVPVARGRAGSVQKATACKVVEALRSSILLEGIPRSNAPSDAPVPSRTVGGVILIPDLGSSAALTSRMVLADRPRSALRRGGLPLRQRGFEGGGAGPGGNVLAEIVESLRSGPLIAQAVGDPTVFTAVPPVPRRCPGETKKARFGKFAQVDL